MATESDRLIVLDKVRLSFSQFLTSEFLDASEVGVERLIDLDGFRLSGSGYLYGEKVEDKLIRYPRGWWQAFKERWFTVWMLKRWPVCYVEHHIDIKALYTQFRPQLSKEKFVLHDASW